MVYKFIKYAVMLTLVISALSLLSACRRTSYEPDSTGTTPVYPEDATIQTSATETTTADTGAASEETYIILDDEKTTVNGSGVTFENNTVTITQGGIYHLTGTLSDGRIYINSDNENKKVKLVLEGVSVSCSTDAPLYVENSPDETVLILASSTENHFSDTARTIAQGVTDYATATIYSKDDLQIEGDGALIVNGNFNKGIFSKNDIDIHGGSIKINSVDDGIRGKESVEIDGGIIDIICGGDGIRTNEETDAEKGFIEINGGTVNITSELDGIQATGDLTFNGGEITVKSGGGSKNTYSYTESYNDNFPGKNMSFPFGGKSPESSIYEESAVNEPSKKAVKADKSLTFNGGTFSFDSVDDCIHAPEVTINTADITAASDDDGIHADETAYINGGSINITSSYEGIEGRVINIRNGEIYINSSDDGFNAASATENTDTQPGGFGGMGGGMFGNDESCVINISDGFVLVNAQGDGIDSNGSVNMSGGKMVVFGPTSGGNGALDYGGSFNVSGGTLFASGSMGMAQSVTGNGVKVVNFNVNGEAGSFYALADSDNNCKFAFTSPKVFQNVVFASDSFNGALSFCQGGSVSGEGESVMGMYFDGIYSPGALIGTLS